MRDVLLYTIAFDPPGMRVQAGMARLLVESLRTAGYAGGILLFRNGAPVFAHRQWELEEREIHTRNLTGLDLAECGCRFKYEAAAKLTDAANYRRIVYLDADMLALRDPEALWSSDEDILWMGEPESSLQGRSCQGHLTEEDLKRHPDRQAANSGMWSIRGDRCREIMAEVLRILDSPRVGSKSWGDQPAWNKALLSSKFSTRQLPPDLVGFPAAFSPHYGNYRQSALLHFLGLPPEQKLPLMLGHWAAHRFRGKTALLMDLLDF